MPNALFFNTYKLKKGSSVPDFLLAVDNLIHEYASKQKGYVSFMLMQDGDTWADCGVFETMEDAKSFENPGSVNEYAGKFYSFLNFNSCKSNIYALEKEYKLEDTAPGAVTLVTFKLKKDASVPDFILASDEVHKELSLKEGGFICRKLMVDKDTWADLILWRTIDDAKDASNHESAKEVLERYFSFIGEVTSQRHFTVERSLS